MPDIAQQLGFQYRRVAHQQGAQALHGLGITYLQPPPRPLTHFPYLRVVIQFQPGPQHRPVGIRAVGMQQPYQARRTFNLYRNRQLLEALHETQLPSPRQVQKPATPGGAVHVQIEPPAAYAGDCQRLMVALHGMEPGLRQPFQRRLAVRATVDQVPHAEQAVHGRIEPHRIQALLQALEVTMDIAHRQVTPPQVGNQTPKPCHYNLPLLVAPCQG
ncbi:hypothetical protein D3C77_529320 [compost metagenome]